MANASCIAIRGSSLFEPVGGSWRGTEGLACVSQCGGLGKESTPAFVPRVVQLGDHDRVVMWPFRIRDQVHSGLFGGTAAFFRIATDAR